MDRRILLVEAGIEHRALDIHAAKIQRRFSQESMSRLRSLFAEIVRMQAINKVETKRARLQVGFKTKMHFVVFRFLIGLVIKVRT